ncbi:fluoride efflux transporter CrcB [soil metagenome]
MSIQLLVLTGLGGGGGAVARYWVDTVIRSRIRSAFPWGTMTINVSGSLILGALTGLASAHLLGAQWLTLLGTGVMGGYTTFSTASVETVRLLVDRHYPAGLVNGLGMIALCVAAASLGVAVGRG